MICSAEEVGVCRGGRPALHKAPLLLLSLLLLLLQVAAAKPAGSARNSSEDQLLVKTEEGLIRGYATVTVYGFPYFSFNGIPYAEPPVGPLRFKEAVPKSAWEGVLDAVTEGSPCAQVNDSGVFLGSEDCLYLNVYVPQDVNTTDSGGLLKVMVWIHGGGFVQGDGGRTQFGPDFIVERGVILVTFNYRLGVLGFLSLENELAPGNLGLKDQNLALQWVRRNIRAFGGDADDVTLVGESAGAASVHHHLLSDMSAGLFTRAIAQSGSALSPWGFSGVARQRAVSLAQALGLPEGSSDQQLLHFLSGLPVERLINNTRAALSERDSQRLFMFVFVPSVEPALPGAFLTEHPAAVLARGNYQRVPYLSGVLSGECNFFSSAVIGGSLSTNESIRNFNDNFVNIVGSDLRLENEKDQNKAAALIRKYYYGDEEITRENDLQTGALLSDLYFQEGVDLAVQYMEEPASVPVYYYRFSFKGPNTVVPDQHGVPHGEDLKYLFLTSTGGQNLDRNSDEGKVRDTLVDMWTNFVKYGEPTPQNASTVATKWIQYTKNNTAFLDINLELKMDSGLDKERMDFWHSILPP